MLASSSCEAAFLRRRDRPNALRLRPRWFLLALDLFVALGACGRFGIAGFLADSPPPYRQQKTRAKEPFGTVMPKRLRLEVGS